MEKRKVIVSDGEGSLLPRMAKTAAGHEGSGENANQQDRPLAPRGMALDLALEELIRSGSACRPGEGCSIDRSPQVMQKASRVCVITNVRGLHARAASAFVRTANRFESDLVVRRGSESASGHSVMGLMTLGVGKDSEILVEASGLDAEAALDALDMLISSGFGEGE